MYVEAPSWVPDAVFYQVFPDRFARSDAIAKPGPMEPWDDPPSLHGFKGGDLLGVVEHLDHLEDLGVTALYLNPVFASASNHRYHTYDYFRIDPLLGGDEALRKLLDAAHRRQMRVVLDGVFNHVGRGFWQFHHVMETGRQSPYLGWFHLDHRRLDEGRQLGAYAADLATENDSSSGSGRADGSASLHALGYKAWWDLPALPKLNVRNPEVRAHLLDVAEHWTRFGADGWRLDVPGEVDPSFWQEFRERVRSVDDQAYLVGELWRVAPEWTRPRGPFDGLMNYPLAWAIIGFAAGAHLDRHVAAEQAEMAKHLVPLDALALGSRITELAGSYAGDAARCHLNLLGSHDTPRLLTSCGGDRRAVHLAVMLLMALPGAPCLYYGDEIGLAGHADPDCRRAFPWDAGAWEATTLDIVRAAIRVRRHEPALRSAQVETLAASGQAILLRRGGPSGLWIAANAGSTEARLPLVDLSPQSLDVLLEVGARPTLSASAERGYLALLLPPRAGAVLRPVA